MTVMITEDGEMSKWHIFKEWFRDLWGIRHFRDFKYWLKNTFVRKHHIIKTKLPMGQWYDTDTRMLYGMMNLFIEFLEKEEPFETIDYDSNEYWKKVKEDILVVKAWWENYDNRLKEIEEALDAWHDVQFVNCKDCSNDWIDRLNQEDTPEIKELFERHTELEDKLDKEEDEMLKKLVDLRHFLWT